MVSKNNPIEFDTPPATGSEVEQNANSPKGPIFGTQGSNFVRIEQQNDKIVMPIQSCNSDGIEIKGYENISSFYRGVGVNDKSTSKFERVNKLSPE